ncbi:nucleotide exchange factor GrpE [Anoxybacterium hadale]|uniref:Nucleotide exchange factor GrpE n=1 Tax=Anoxybacterium hadale TaxID=3408580 RepID=A0ACD1A9J7_9FIRM|nr:nucleotide exchange factor GrpE [Clostridiales bacterium]
MSKKKAPEDTAGFERKPGSETSEETMDTEAFDKNASAGTEEADQANSGGNQTGNEEQNKEDEELNTRYLRLAADFQNFRKRVEKEKSDIYAYANEKIVVDLLDVIDNFERALEHSEGSSDSFSEGMNMIFKQFKGVLEKSGVEEMTPHGEPFDPNFHHAVIMENSSEHESGNITQVLQKGYLLNKKVIRPAMVKVAE